MIQLPLSFSPEKPKPSPSGAVLRDRGIRKAVEHAERREPGWQEMALAFLENYCRSHREFAGESVREASKGIVPEAAHARAWGAVLVAGAKRGWIRQVGYVQVRNAAAHRANAALWGSEIYDEKI